MKERIILHRYINELLRNQNMTNTPLLEDIFTKRDYLDLLQTVLTVIKANPHATLTTLRFELFKRSGLKEILNNFVNQAKITPGVLLDFGTFKTRDTILCGNSQEFNVRDGKFIYDPKPIEQDTIFDLASTSKLFTCIAILKLEELGLIDIYEPVKKYVPQFIHLDDVTIYDLLKFRIMVITDKRVDFAKTKEEAEQILFTAHKKENQNFTNGYTDIGAMILRYVVEATANMPFTNFVEEIILNPVGMKDTHLNVPFSKLHRVANENFSTIIHEDGTANIRYDNFPGTPQDTKAIAIGALDGIAPGHAGYFSTKDDMIKLAKALIDGKILSKESVLSISDNVVGYETDGKYTDFYGSLVFLKQPNEKNIYLPLSGKTFISPGFAGTTLCVDPINKITLFIGSNRLHNRIYQIHPNQKKNIIVDSEHNKKTFILPNGDEKIICADFVEERKVLLKLAIDLSLQYQLLENIFPTEKEMHLVRELN